MSWATEDLCVILCGNFLRTPDEVDDGASGPRISSLSGANRKRKRRAREEEKAEEESSDLDSSDEEMDDSRMGNRRVEATNVSESKEPASSCQEKEVEKKEEKKEMSEESGPARASSKKPSEPAIFISVDRLPEIQVCVSCGVFVSHAHSLFFSQAVCICLYFSCCVCACVFVCLSCNVCRIPV